MGNHERIKLSNCFEINKSNPEYSSQWGRIALNPNVPSDFESSNKPSHCKNKKI